MVAIYWGMIYDGLKSQRALQNGIEICLLLLLIVNCGGLQGFSRFTQSKKSSTNNDIIQNNTEVTESSVIGDNLNREPILDENHLITLETTLNASPIIERVEASDLITENDNIPISVKVCDANGEINDIISLSLTLSDMEGVIYSEFASSTLTSNDSNNNICGEHIFNLMNNIENGEYNLKIIASDKYEGTSNFEEIIEVFDST